MSIFVQALQFLWAASFDLHVLGMPPAFILSQDQTLIKKDFFYLKIINLSFDHKATQFDFFT